MGVAENTIWISHRDCGNKIRVIRYIYIKNITATAIIATLLAMNEEALDLQTKEHLDTSTSQIVRLDTRLYQTQASH